jgi:endonuclease/exonuclease/phosphatase family metal-dependent hydrolase
LTPAAASPDHRGPEVSLRRAGFLSLLLVASCDPFNTGFDDVEGAVVYRAAVETSAPAPTAGTIEFMTYNVKYGGARLRFFWECNGSRTLMTEGEVTANLDALAARILAEGPDVVLLQEVDTWRSKRAAYVDEVQYILDRVGLNHGAYASQWKADYVPSDGMGSIDSGNAVLSRWPVAEATRHALSLISDSPSLERYFYLKRNVLEVRIAVPEVGDLWVLATHAEAFSDDGTKKLHIDRLKELMDARAATGARVIGGGDLNEIPPTSPVREDFPEDAGCTDGRFEPDTYAGEETWLDDLYASYEPDVTPAAFGAAPDPWYTFVGDEHSPLNRKLDHLFTNGHWQNAQVLQDWILLSDHVPVVAELVIP